ncbi:MAG: hypothetical protein KME17_20915 [Cyanosarcina radialis HA8281-LM2]|jgi:hypothetical protein|nr:hypothetical protein [Cyanosarcina radialis HA8281-LM2]
MFFIRKSTVLFAVGTALSLSLVGCGESKVSQCNKLTGSGNKLATTSKKYEDQTNALQKEGAPKDLNAAKATFAKLAAILNSFGGEVKTIKQEASGFNFSDDKLKGFHGRYITILTEQEQLATNGSKLFDKASKLGNPEEFSQVLPEIANLSQKSEANEGEQKKLVSEVNTYCGASS